MEYNVTCLSKNKVKKIVKYIVRFLKINGFFPKYLLLTFETFLTITDFSLDVVEECELPTSYAEVRPFEKKVLIRRKIYDDAISGDYEALFIIAHEFGHFVMHRNNLSLCKSSGIYNKNLDPEWQADEFAKKLLSYGHFELKHKKVAS